MDPETNLIATGKIPESLRFMRILEPSNLSAGLYFALIAVLLVYLYLQKTRSGYELRMFGMNPMFAKYGGISVHWYRRLANVPQWSLLWALVEVWQYSVPTMPV